MRCDDDNELKTEGNAAWPLITIAADGFHEFYIVIIIIIAVVVLKICISASRRAR